MENKNILHDFNQVNKESFFSIKLFISIAVVVVLGFATGFLLSRNTNTAKTTGAGGLSSTELSSVQKGATFGSDDLKTFKDIAEGDLKEGGFEGEGQYHLVRPGGESQYVYLTSSVIDLSQFAGHKVKVWGQTNDAQKVGWLMDVGRVEVLE